MRHFLRLIIATFLISSQVEAQALKDTADFPYWWDMMHDRNTNFFQTQRAFNAYWENKPLDARSHSGFKVFKRWEHHWKSRVNGDGSFRPADYDITEYKKFIQRNSSRAANGAWVELGPRILPTNSTSQPNGLGRINAIAFHPTNVNTYFIGAPQGGVWKTINNGATWTMSGTDNLPSLGASTIAIDPTNDQIMYLGTGDRDAGDAAGVGVYKSTNGGASWTVSNTGMGNREVNRIILNSLKNTTLLAAASDGIYKSYNSGATWIKKSSVNANYREMKMKPNDTTIWYATEGSKFYRSSNGGETWTQITSVFGATITRMVIATCPSKPNMVYVVGCKSNGTYEGMYISDNAGLNFRLKSSTPNILGYLSDGSDAKGQGNYDLALASDYDDPKIIYVGGINIFKSEDSGSTWTCVAHWTGANFIEKIHADQHIFEVNPLNKILFAGHDGGIYSTSDQGATWDDKTSGLGIAQIYRLGQNLLNPNSVITGYQDNGTAMYRSTWNTVIGGDGMECIIDHLDTTYQYGALYYGDVRRRSGAGGFNQIAGLDQSNNPVNGVTENGAWVTPYCLNPSNTNTMVIGYKNIWRSTNVKANPPTWTRISSNGGGNITSCAFGNANNNHFYYWRNNSFLYRSTNINAATPTWDSVTIPGTSGSIEDIETHPTDANRIWIVRGTKVFRSQDRGANWTDITLNLPGNTKNTIVMDKNSPEGLYVGTDAGVYYKDSTMATWRLYSTGLPVGSAINDLEIYYHPLNNNLSRISAATYGRGLWQSDLYSTQTQPIVNYYATDSVPCVGSTITLNDVSSPACQNFLWTITPATYTLMGATTLNSKNPQVRFDAPGAYTIRLFAVSYGNGYDTTIKTNYINVKTSSNVSISSLNKNSICAGDSALISVTGAVNYSWSPAGTCTAPTSATTYLKPTANTTYIVTGSAAGGGCIDTESVFITVKALPIVNVTGNNAICLGQSTTLNATSSSGTITWSPSTGLNTTTGTSVIAAPTVTTTYNASATGANACIGNFNFPLTVNPRPKINISGNNIICSSGSTNLTASGANNLTWTPGLGLNIQSGPNVTANPINTTTYTIIGNNAQNCFDTAKYTVNVVPNANVTILPSATSICLGDTATFNLKGCITYTISPNTNTSFKNDSTIYVFQNTNGLVTYTIEGTISATCKNTKTQALTVNPKPTVGLAATKSTINKGESTILNASGATNYAWSPSATLSSSSGASVTATPSDTTTYTVIGTNQFNCSNKATIKIIVLKNSSINGLSEKIKMYPNPTTALINIEMTEKSKMVIYDVNSKIVYTANLPIGLSNIDLSKLAKGEYIVKFGNEQKSNYKLILE